MNAQRDAAGRKNGGGGSGGGIYAHAAAAVATGRRRVGLNRGVKSIVLCVYLPLLAFAIPSCARHFLPFNFFCCFFEVCALFLCGVRSMGESADQRG